MHYSYSHNTPKARHNSVKVGEVHQHDTVSPQIIIRSSLSSFPLFCHRRLVASSYHPNNTTLCPNPSKSSLYIFKYQKSA